MVKHKLTKNLLLLLSLIVLLLIEFSSRLYFLGWSTFSITRTNSFHGMPRGYIIQPSPFSDIIYELKPNLNTYWKMAKFITNSQGLPDKEYSIDKPGNTFRVNVIGDSYAMPEGVDIENAYHTLLEDRFNKDNYESSFEFINFGVGGYNLKQYLAVMKNKGIKYNPDLILLSFCANNDYKVAPPTERTYNNHFDPKSELPPFYSSFFLKLIQRVSIQSENRAQTNDNTFSEDQLTYLEGRFTDFGKFSKEHKIPIVIVYLEPEPRQFSPLDRFARENEMYFVDITSAFEGKEYSNYIIFPTDIHPNAMAHEIFADKIFYFIKPIIEELIDEK
jgi:hypothetical protein